MLKIAYSDQYEYGLPDGHRFPMEKYPLLAQQIVYEGTVSKEQFFIPSILSLEDLFFTHSEEYYDSLMLGTLSRREEKKIGFPVHENLLKRGRIIAQGTVDCVKYARENGIAMNIAGGTHHSFGDHGEGFCVFNDIAIATNLHLRKHREDKILIIDLDVHQGNGTAHIFKDCNQVFTFSMHGEMNYPVKKEKSRLDIGLEDGTEDHRYLDALMAELDIIIDDFKPDVAFYQSGVDVLSSDKLGRLNLSIEGCKKRDEYVINSCFNRNIPLAITMGGGYSADIRAILEAHSNTFRIAQDVLEQ